ncbi:Rpn family recombination-promoting nuclease/putative transposase [Duganella vulcania]|uniref:Transposase (putative) YhgA-like domain-containing protein n=1 Tax=Duganella vulcania TaxID=2692166 RepID=A0A845GPF1_9BURK|nr:Rpn family recombination-promoting nuclease/putative transposase [Duganella vulcania]MYM95300.1 hypothetical protein [Duganella vulcania]
MASEDDTAYKQLFAYPEMVRDLLLGFVPGDWVHQLDLASLERVNGSYVSDGGHHRHSDMVWRVRLAGEWIYIYLLLEFQSRSDHWMALRMQVYVGLLYQDLIKRQEVPETGRLPPVFPLVLYNGKRRWKASLNLAGLITAVPAEIQHLQPAQSYLLIDQQRLPVAALAMFENLVATAFRIERLATEQDIAGELETWRQQPEMAHRVSAQQALARWAAVRLQRLARERMINLRIVSEAKTMSVPFFDSLDDALRYEAELYGNRQRLKKLLIKRFGSLPNKLSRRVESAEMDQLDVWFDRLLEVHSIQEIFAESEPA